VRHRRPSLERETALWREGRSIVAGLDEAGRGPLAGPVVAAAVVFPVGAKPILMDAAAHDRALAFLSHAPQVVSWALFEAALGDQVARRFLPLAGPGFRDMTRLARSPRSLWGEILGQNRVEVARALRAVTRALARPPGRRAR